MTDTGQTPYTGASLTDPLAAVLDDAAYDSDAAATAGTAGTVSYAGSAVSWTGDLAPGGVGDHHLFGHREQPRHRRPVLTNTVTSATPGSNCPAGGTDPAAPSPSPWSARPR